MCSVQQEHQRGAHSMIGDRIYWPVLVSYIIPRVIRNSFISRMHPSLMLLLNTTHRVVAIRIGVLEKRGDWNGRIRLYPGNTRCECTWYRVLVSLVNNKPTNSEQVWRKRVSMSMCHSGIVNSIGRGYIGSIYADSSSLLFSALFNLFAILLILFDWLCAQWVMWHMGSRRSLYWPKPAYWLWSIVSTTLPSNGNNSTYRTYNHKQVGSIARGLNEQSISALLRDEGPWNIEITATLSMKPQPAQILQFVAITKRW